MVMDPDMQRDVELVPQLGDLMKLTQAQAELIESYTKLSEAQQQVNRTHEKVNAAFRKLLQVATAILLMLALAMPRASAASATQQIQISSQLVFGMQSVYPNVLFQYQEPGTTTAQFGASTVVSIPANSTDNSIDLATLFPGCVTPVAIGIQEITSPALQLNVGLSNGGARIHMAAGGFMIQRVDTANFPTFYVDNASLSSAALVRVFLLSN